MQTKKFYLASLSGFVSFFLLGFLIYGLFLQDFMNTHTPLSKDILDKVMKPMSEMNWKYMLVSNIAAAFFISIIVFRSNLKSFIDGLKLGASLGALLSLSYDFGFMSYSNLFSRSSALADIIGSTVIFAITAGVVGMINGKMKD